MMLDYKDTSVSTDDRPYYFTIDRMYNVRMVVDRAGAIIERYAYDPYGRPLIREAPGRGDMDNDNLVGNADKTRFDLARAGTIWDPRADMDDDGDVDSGQWGQDAQLFNTKHVSGWPPFLPYPPPPNPTVAQAFSDAGNPYMFQGRPHFALDTAASATVGKLMINDHRARPEGPVIGRWLTRDPLDYNTSFVSLTFHQHTVRVKFTLRPESESSTGLPPVRRTEQACLYAYGLSNPRKHTDPLGLMAQPPADCSCSSIFGVGYLIDCGAPGSNGNPDGELFCKDSFFGGLLHFPGICYRRVVTANCEPSTHTCCDCDGSGNVICDSHTDEHGPACGGGGGGCVYCACCVAIHLWEDL